MTSFERHTKNVRERKRNILLCFYGAFLGFVGLGLLITGIVLCFVAPEMIIIK